MATMETDSAGDRRHLDMAVGLDVLDAVSGYVSGPALVLVAFGPAYQAK
jgi:hypothetical protein